MQQYSSCNCASARLLQQLLQLEPELALLLQQLQQGPQSSPTPGLFTLAPDPDHQMNQMQSPFQFPDPGSFPVLPQPTPNEQLQQQPPQFFITPGSFPAVAADDLQQLQPTNLLLLQPPTTSHAEEIEMAMTNNVMTPNVSITFVGTAITQELVDC